MHLTNWNKTEASEPLNIFKPKSEAEIAGILKQARAKKLQVRVVGPSRHTWGQISMSTGLVIDMQNFNKILAVDKKAKQVTVQAGYILHKLFRTLAGHGLSVNNMGGIDAQTIAGVVSTGTHGSSIYHGTFADDVIGMRVMLASGKIVDIKKGHKDFPAFQVSLGTLGVLLSVTLQCTELFYVKSATKESKLDLSKLSKTELLPLLKKHYFLQALINPYSNRIVFFKRDKVATCDLSSFKRRLSLPVRSVAQAAKEILGITLTEYMLLPVLPFLKSRTKSIISRSTQFTHEDCTDLSFRALTIGGNDLKGLYLNKTFHDQEYAIELDDTPAALKRILTLFKNYKGIPLMLALRFVKGSDAWLSPSYGRMTCYIDVLIFAKDFSLWEKFIQEVEKALYPLKGRPHWGKHNYLTYARIQEKKLYPKLNAFRKTKAAYDPANLFGNAFTDERLQPL